MSSYESIARQLEMMEIQWQVMMEREAMRFGNWVRKALGLLDYAYWKWSNSLCYSMIGLC
jgi:hypothetical protein